MTRDKLPFRCADILLPKRGFEKWATVACDQFTSEPEYWNDVERFVGDAPSALHITLPEIYLDDDAASRIRDIDRNMFEYLSCGVFDEFKNDMVYIERTLPGGLIRRGIVGAVDLEAYSFERGSDAMIRATEGTVLDRIPPRVKIRRGAPLELPHVMLLIDDMKMSVIEPCSDEDKTPAYDFRLMQGGGSIRGWHLSDKTQERIENALCELAGDAENPFLFAVGDGNHSLATAKACYEQNKTPLNRYALVEVVNIHDPALHFEPIYRVMFNVDPDDVISGLRSRFSAGGPQKVEYITEHGVGTVFMPPLSALPVGTLQIFIDEYLAAHKDAKVDFIHGEDVARSLAARRFSVGFIFDGMTKNQLFTTVERDGALPRKTFSMGEAQSKRYYIEARRIDCAK
ncbi:MAG: DUF1015 domain-containing protein [Eubacteriales bacterium]